MDEKQHKIKKAANGLQSVVKILILILIVFEKRVPDFGILI